METGRREKLVAATPVAVHDTQLDLHVGGSVGARTPDDIVEPTRFTPDSPRFEGERIATAGPAYRQRGPAVISAQLTSKRYTFDL